MRIVVLAGGLSSERNVSISTGSMVTAALRELHHEVAFLDMFLGMEMYDEGVDIFKADIPESFKKIDKKAPDLKAVKESRHLKSDSMFGENVLEICQSADIVFLALHGNCGEDGRVQATFDLLGIAYTGSGYLGSGIAMDKDATKRFLKDTDVLTPSWETITYAEKDISPLVEKISVPVVVKVLQGGSSLGVSVVKSNEELHKALVESLSFSDTVMLEQYISGREFTCGVLDGEALPSVEIIPQVAFYDYESKYQVGATVELCPAPISPELEKTLGDAAKKVHETLGLAVYSRSDFMVDEEGKAYFLEVNTLPGMTPTSLVPQEAAAVGMSYNALCQKIIDSSILARKEGK